MNFANRFYGNTARDIGQTPASLATSDSLIDDSWKLLIASLVASLVRTSRFQANGPALQTILAVDYGLSSHDLLATYDPVSCCWKTFQTSFMWEEISSLDSLPKWGMTRCGSLYKLPSLALPISANAGSLWPTTTASDDKNRQPGNPHLTKNGTIRHIDEDGNQSFMRLSQVVKLWSTPRSSMNRDDIGSGEIVDGRLHRGGNIYGLSLPTQVRTWATPTVSDAKRSGQYGGAAHTHDTVERRYLRGQIVEPGNPSTCINPAWELMLMGFPTGWLHIDGQPDKGRNSIHMNRRALSRRAAKRGKAKSGQSVTLWFRSRSTRLPSHSASFYRASMG